jgi:hypothetical protein
MMDGWSKMYSGLLFHLSIAAAALFAQQSPASMDDSQPDDIVVKGYRSGKEPIKRVRAPAAVSIVRNRQTYEYSEKLAKCAARGRLANLSRLRDVVDGEFNQARQVAAQDRLFRINITCSQSTTLQNFRSPPRAAQSVDLQSAAQGGFAGPLNIPDAAPLGRSIYDRGAFTIAAMKMYAPGITLTRQEVNDPAVQARFNAREAKRNRFRLPADYRYFEVAVCMVRVEPRLAVRLALSDGPARLGDVQEALIDRARICVGNAKSVRVDPTQFRLYIADAVYRWTVAVRGVDSLIPAG